MRSIACIIIFYLMFVMPVKAQDSPPDPDRYPAGHFLDHRPLAKGFGTAKRLRSSPSGIRSSTSSRREGFEGSPRLIASGPPAGCPSRAWCGCWLAKHLGMNDRSLWLARNWARIGSPAAGPSPGVVAVFARGRGGHVGIVTGVPGPGRVVLLSGNDKRAVRERERSTRGIIAYRHVGARYALR